MGGDSLFVPASSSEEESLLDRDSPQESVKSSVPSGHEEHLSSKLESGLVMNGEGGSTSEEFPVEVCRNFWISEAAERQRVKVHEAVFRSYEGLMSRIERLDEAKTRVLSYRPGSWAEKVDGMDLTEYNVPSITTLLLVGPKCSGKSSLINNISRVLEDDVFSSERAPVSNNTSTGEGTYFLHEYTIPRASGSFCVYDTRSLSADRSENMEILKRWMTKGVHHGELVTRKSDDADLKALLKCKDRVRSSSSLFRVVNFVIFVVNGLSLLESMDGNDEQQYSQMISTNFSNPLLSFKDDKPVVVVTHGDLLPLPERLRIRVYLGELLGIPPTGQIFDIPDNNDPSTKLAIVDMVAYCLERADRNLPYKTPSLLEGQFLRNRFKQIPTLTCLLLWVVMLMTVVLLIHPSTHAKKARHNPAHPTPPLKVEWHKIRHLWLE